MRARPDELSASSGSSAADRARANRLREECGDAAPPQGRRVAASRERRRSPGVPRARSPGGFSSRRDRRWMRAIWMWASRLSYICISRLLPRERDDPLVELDVARGVGEPSARLPPARRSAGRGRAAARCLSAVARPSAFSAARHSRAHRMSNASATSSGETAVTNVPLRGRISTSASASSRVSASFTRRQADAELSRELVDVQALPGREFAGQDRLP